MDYAAPTGTPVWAVADGTVLSAGWVEGFGNQVVLGHDYSFRTYYGHLSHFETGIAAGKKVEQKEVIGYVGSTGFSTGPHLDFRVTQNGKYCNPLTVDFPSGKIRELENKEKFMAKRDKLLARLKGE